MLEMFPQNGNIYVSFHVMLVKSVSNKESTESSLTTAPFIYEVISY